MRTRFALIAVAAAAFVIPAVAAPIPKVKEAPKDEKLIEGTWAIDAFEGGPAGGGGPPPDVKSIKFTFKEGKVTMLGGPAGIPAMEREGEYKLDTTTKPKQLDMTMHGQTAPGIYELDGDTLKWCMSEGQGAARPEEMKGGGKTVLVTFKRVKEEKDDKKEDKKDEPKKETPKVEPPKTGK